MIQITPSIPSNQSTPITPSNPITPISLTILTNH